MSGEQIMTPGHPRWQEFIARLEKAAICWQTTESAEAVLEAMGGIDVAASILAIRELGGECDCEIVYRLGERHTAVCS